jgi:hypothetical protein
MEDIKKSFLVLQVLSQMFYDFMEALYLVIVSLCYEDLNQALEGLEDSEVMQEERELESLGALIYQSYIHQKLQK